MSFSLRPILLYLSPIFVGILVFSMSLAAQESGPKGATGPNIDPVSKLTRPEIVAWVNELIPGRMRYFNIHIRNPQTKLPERGMPALLLLQMVGDTALDWIAEDVIASSERRKPLPRQIRDPLKPLAILDAMTVETLFLKRYDGKGEGTVLLRDVFDAANELMPILSIPEKVSVRTRTYQFIVSMRYFDLNGDGYLDPNESALMKQVMSNLRDSAGNPDTPLFTATPKQSPQSASSNVLLKETRR